MVNFFGFAYRLTNFMCIGQTFGFVTEVVIYPDIWVISPSYFLVEAVMFPAKSRITLQHLQEKFNLHSLPSLQKGTVAKEPPKVFFLGKNPQDGKKFRQHLGLSVREHHFVLWFMVYHDFHGPIANLECQPFLDIHFLKVRTPFLIWLVVSNIFYFPFHIWDVVLPIDELIFFKMVKSPPTSWRLNPSH